MNENHDRDNSRKNFSDKRLVEILSAGSDRAASPDQAFLSRLREKSTTAFLESQPTLKSAPKDGSMLFLRLLAGLTTVAAVVAVAILLQPADLRIKSQIRELAGADSSRWKLVADDQSGELISLGRQQLIQRPGMPDVMFDGTRSFEVIAEENTARPLPTFSTLPVVIDFIRQLPTLAAAIPSLQRSEERVIEQEPCDVYPMEMELNQRPVRVEWLIAQRTGKVKSLLLAPLDLKGELPTARLTMVALNEPVDEAPFKIAETLTEDGRIGKFADVQGTVSLRPKAYTRWTPVCAPGGILKPGDWVRTDVRGANAVAVQLVPETKLLLGPGSLVELLRPTQLKVLSGEFEVSATVKHPVELTAPDGSKVTVMSPEIFRVQGEKLVKLAKEPLWLAGFKGTTPQETLGSLIAKVDGRNVPLHVGYHKVSVEIRDQIARTTIEESFVNSTDTVLEGQFHFPLPADASISGFGMWVGDRLVEADIVEKQRAREIYETILREKRDPGLLEWSGGNIFKARVYPIPAHSEKRIKIVYTQVLPREGNSYRYSYALQSELLRQFPVRELNLTVTVSSVAKLAAISCPTHPARLQNAGHSARAEFSAQEYSPTKDFEVVVQFEDDKQGVVMIPHRRGDDGYFLLLLSPPSESGPWQRDVVPDGEPLKLIVLADTSASMDKNSRKTQDEVLGALLGSLGPKDSFQLAACDVDCVWAAEKAQSPEMKNIETARTFLAKRRSMGWTDLDKAFAEALKRADRKTQVVYLGDGVVTTGDADGQAFAKRLVKLAEGKNPHPGPLPKGEGVTFHAIAVSSSYESPVMKAIGSVGGGSVRNVSGEKGPQQTAKDLLAEIARPSLKGVNVKFNGFRTARVYPGTLTNLPLGTQQIILGRYLPPGTGSGGVFAAKTAPDPLQQGEVVVTGTLGGKEVTYRTAVSLKDAENGNSFIPRLWARMHLDELLAQGTSQAVQDEIINLSEEYHLMTPYTSLLVLESDADRERFKVERRFQMRDGERFFADAQDKAQYELVQQQMRIAGNWRTQLRNKVLIELAGLGRDPQLFEQRKQELEKTLKEELRSIVQLSDGFSGSGSGFMHRGMGFGGGGLGGGGGMGGGGGGWGGGSMGGEGNFLGYLGDLDAKPLARSPFDGDADEFSWLGHQRGENGGVTADFVGLIDLIDNTVDPNSWDDVGGPGSVAEFPTNLSLVIRQEHELNGRLHRPGLLTVDGRRGTVGLYDSWNGGFLEPNGGFDYSQALGEDRSQPRLLPISLHSPLAGTKPAAELLAKQSQEVRELVLSLLREEKVRALPGGVEIRRETESLDPRFAEVNAKSSSRDLLSGKLGWLNQEETDGSWSLANWCDSTERGVWSPAYELALVRKAAKNEHLRWKGSVEDFSLVDALRYVRPEDVVLEHPAPDQTLLILGREVDEEGESDSQTRILIDTKQQVVLSVETRYEGKIQSTQKFADFIEVADRFWPQTQEMLDSEGRRTSLTKSSVKVLSAADFTAELKTAQTAREPSLTLHLPLPTLAAAKAAQLKLGDISVEVYLRLLMHAAGKQDWEQVREYLTRCEELTKGKRWPRWLRLYVLSVSRRHEELKTELMQMAGDLSAKPHEQEWTLVKGLLVYGDSYLGTQEKLDLLAALHPVYARSPAYLQRDKDYDQSRLQHLVSAGRVFEADALRKDLAERYPRDLHLQTEYVQWLARRGDYEGAYAWLAKALGDARAKWLPDESYQLQWSYLELLDQQGRFADKLEYLTPILAKDPDYENIYSQYLVALIYSGREADAEKLMKEWLAAELHGQGKAAARARAYAAVYLITNQIHPFGSGEYDTSWHKPLAEFVLRNAEVADWMTSNTVQAILRSGQFSESDEAARLGAALAARLLAEADKLAPGQLDDLVDYVQNYGHSPDEKFWEKVASIVQARWEKEKPGSSRAETLDRVLLDIHQETSAETRIAFLRLRVKRANDESRAEMQRQLFDELIGQSWSAETEAETLVMLDKLSSGETAEIRLLEWLSHLYRWTDRMQAARNELLEGKIEKREQMTRQDLAEKRKKNGELVRTELANRLAAAAKNRQDELGRWMLLESLHLNVQLERDLPKVTETAWQMLEQTLVAKKKADAGRKKGDELDEEQAEVQGTRDLLLAAEQARLVTMLVHVAAKPSAKPQDADRLLKLSDEQALLADKQKDDEDAPPSLDWRQVKYNLLVALDQPKELATQLAKWVAADTADHRWQKSLGYLNAELGKLEEAIKQFEGLESSGELSAADYRSLATWYQATKQDVKNAQAKVSVYKTMDENALLQLMNNRAGNASDVTPEDLLAYQAYFARASNPASGLGAVEGHYRATQDFRLLAGLADAVIGHTSGQVYSFLSQVDGVLDEIHTEATVDELVQRIAEVRARTKTPVDLRGLDLLELLVERRGAQIQNQAGPHLAAAVAALQRSEKREWSTGEPLQFAQMLANISFTEQPALAAEQLRIVGALHAAAKPGSLDRLDLADLMHTIHWRHDRPDQAIDILSAACDEFREAQGGKSTQELRPILFTLIDGLQSSGLYVRAEGVLQADMAHAATPPDAYQLRLRLYDLYVEALREHGDTSLGKDESLYAGCRKQLLALLEASTDQRERPEYHERLCELFEAAHENKIAAAGKDVAELVASKFPDLAQRQIHNYRNMVSTMGNTVRTVLGPREALAFYIDRMEHEPAWLARSGDDGWNEYHHELADLRQEVPKLGTLEPRLLALVIAELKRDMRTHMARTRDIYSNDHHRFWSERAADFAKAAEEVLAENKDGRESIVYITTYLINGLDLADRGIEILFDANRRELLDDSGKQLLISTLFRQQRHGEAIALLEALIRKQPGNFGWRTQLMHAYFMTKQPQALLKLLAETDKLFIAPHPNDEGILTAMAGSTLENELYEQAASYYERAIKVRTDALQSRTQGDGTLASYFQQQAKAYAGLGNTALAVDKASAAIVIWPARHDRRQEAINLLLSMLHQSPNLDAYVAELDREVEKSQQDRPIVRKQIGIAYQEQHKAWDKAIKQFRLALDLTPDDTDLHQRLIASLDAKEDKAGALAQTLETLEINRRNLGLWENLAERLTALEQLVEAERAATSLVEVGPLESEGHEKLANYRERQDRWDDAINQWREVARLRKLEPTGLLRLAPALLHQKRLEEFDSAMKQLENGPWPQHFDERLKEELPKLRESRLKAHK